MWLAYTDKSAEHQPLADAQWLAPLQVEVADTDCPLQPHPTDGDVRCSARRLIVANPPDEAFEIQHGEVVTAQMYIDAAIVRSCENNSGGSIESLRFLVANLGLL